MKTILRHLFIALAFLAGIDHVAAQGTAVFPIATNGAASQAGMFAAFNGTNYLVGIQGDGTTNSTAITAQLISTNGVVVGPRIFTGRNGGIPFVASGGTNFLLLWSDNALVAAGGNDQVYGQFINGLGAPVGGRFTFGPTNEEQDMQAGGGSLLAFDGRNYLAVWDTGGFHDAPSGNVHGALFNQSGSLIVPISITSGTNAELTPTVTFGKTNYLVVWNDVTSGNIDGELISTNGTAGTPFVINQTATPSYNPCCTAFDGTNFFVVWNQNIGSYTPSTIWNLYGRVVSSSGTFPWNEVAMVTDPNNPVWPSLAFDGANYLLAWNTGVQSSNSQIVFQFFNPAGSSIGQEFNLFAPKGTNDPIFGSVCFDGTHFEIAALVGGATGITNSGFAFTSATGTYGTFLSTNITTSAALGYLYMTNAGGTSITITGYSGPAAALTIPATINSLPVTSIGTNAFFGNAGLTSVIIPNGVTNIGFEAFANCTSLTAVDFQGNAPKTDSTAFNGDAYTTIFYLSNATGWSSPFAGIPAVLSTPNSLRVSISPASAVSGGAQWQVDGGTWQSNGVTVSNLASGVHTVTFNTLNGWTTPATQTITANATWPVTLLGTYGNTPYNYTTNNGTITITKYIGYGGAVIIPSTINNLPVTSIGADAFADCESLNSLIIPSTVTNLGEYAFGDCESLTNIYFPVYFYGNAPTADGSAFGGDDQEGGLVNNTTAYYLAGTTGWAGFSTKTAIPIALWYSVQYSANQTTGFSPLTVQFNCPSTDNTGNGISSWNWIFGDGTTTNVQSPLHVYASAGNFQPVLIGTNNLGFPVGGLGSAIAVGTAPTISIPQTNYFALLGGNVALLTSVAGSGPFTYQWQLNGTNLPNGIITTVAGNGNEGFNGDQEAATNAWLYGPAGVAVDATGNLFIAEEFNLRIRKVDTNGIITTVAGNGSYGYNGDGEAATNAWLCDPAGVAVDAAGNLFVADEFNLRIRKVGTNGIITTVAGNGSYGYSGDGEAATNAWLCDPTGVAVDATGNLFIADSNNQRIRKVATNGIITTVAGNGNEGYKGDGGMATSAELYLPAGVALDGTGNLFIADQYNQRIRKVDTNGIITTVAGGGNEYPGDGGAAINVDLSRSSGVAMDAGGDLFIADTGNQRIRKVGVNGIITTVAGSGNEGYFGDNGAAINAELNEPSGVVVDAKGSLFIADQDNQLIRKVVFQNSSLNLNDVSASNAGIYDLVVSSAYGSITSSVVNLQLLGPPVILTQPLSQAVAIGSNVTLSVAVTGTTPLYCQWYCNNAPVSGQTNLNFQLNAVGLTNAGSYFVVVTNLLGSATSSAAVVTVGFPPVITTQLSGQTIIIGGSADFSVSVTGSGPFSYQWQLNGTNLINDIITTVAGNGNSGYNGDGEAATNAYLCYPSGVAVDATGNLFIADYYNQRIRKVSTNGIITTVAGNGNSGYNGDGEAATNAYLYYPTGVAVDATGNLFIADDYNQRIRKVSTNGIITTVAGNGNSGYNGDGEAATNAYLYDPNGVAVDATGNLFIADFNNQRIRKVGANGIITTVAGNGASGYNGDGEAATIAYLYDPHGVAVDPTGNLFIADEYNQRIRKVGANGIITTVAGNGNSGYNGDGEAATNAYLYDPPGVAVDPTGNLFIADYYNQRIRRVAVPSPVLVINTVGYANAGEYDVVVSDPYGSITSSVVNVAVTLFTLTAPKVPIGKTNFTFQLSGPAGTNYVLQSSTNLVNWTSFSTSSIPPSGIAILTNAISGVDHRFFRVSSQ